MFNSYALSFESDQTTFANFVYQHAVTLFHERAELNKQPSLGKSPFLALDESSQGWHQ